MKVYLLYETLWREPDILIGVYKTYKKASKKKVSLEAESSSGYYGYIIREEEVK